MALHPRAYPVRQDAISTRGFACSYQPALKMAIRQPRPHLPVIVGAPAPTAMKAQDMTASMWMNAAQIKTAAITAPPARMKWALSAVPAYLVTLVTVRSVATLTSALMAFATQTHNAKTLWAAIPVAVTMALWIKTGDAYMIPALD